LFLDRPLPFLCVYRRPPDRDDPGTSQLATSEASYLIASGHREDHALVAQLARVLCGGLAADFGGFLLVEVWATPPAETAARTRAAPHFRLVSSRHSDLTDSMDDLEAALGAIAIPSVGTLGVAFSRQRNVGAPEMSPLLTGAEAEALGCHVLGIEVPAVYADGDGTLFPVVHRVLRRGFSRALKRCLYRFTQNHTDHRPVHYQSLGSRSVTRRVWEVDKALARIAGQFDFLLLTTPRNAEEAWAEFRRRRFERPPRFSYRPRPVDVPLAKRELYAIPVERIEDPTLADLFREQQEEMDRKLTMLGERETARFRHESVQLFGGVEDSLLGHALEILRGVPPRSRERSRGAPLDARAFAKLAEREIAHLRRVYGAVQARVEIRSDVAGLMVSRGNLLVGTTSRIPAARVEALIQHEVGTHILTYCNGLAQPLRQLRTGLPAYEEVQEGLAVLAEFLVGGLSRPRLRLLAARVVAVRHMLEGGSFVDVFRELDRTHDFERRTAFAITMRVFRGGGHTKDAVYLRGLLRLLDYFRAGKPLEPLYIGKIGLHHLPILNELRLRNVLRPPPLMPRVLDRPDVGRRLQRLRDGLTPLGLVEHETRRRRA
jgi:uncharacterized protein (TIGR02421 family)